MTIRPDFPAMCRRAFRRGAGGLAVGLLLAAPALADAVQLPSGQSLELQELLVEPHGDSGIWARARFIAPQIGGALSFAEVEADFAVLCQDVALPKLAEDGQEPAIVIVSLADRAVDFGTTDPDATQFFEAFRVENGLCIWEGF